MTKIRERLPEIRERTLKLFHKMKEKQGEDDPVYWGGYMSDHRMFSVCAYVLDKNVHGFFDHMKQVVHYQLRFFEELEKGTPVGDGSMTNTSCFSENFNALCTDDIPLILNLNEKMANVPLSPKFYLSGYFHKAFRWHRQVNKNVLLV